MTNQQMQYAYWQRMRQQSLYRVYTAGCGTTTKEYEGLCFTAEESGSTIKLQNIAGEYQTSTDGQNWTDYELGSVITLSEVGDKIYFAAKSENATCWEGHENNKFIMTGKIAASGNIQSLLDKECQRSDVPPSCYMHIFGNCTSLTKPPSLPATTLSEQCYYTMFLGCSSLAMTPALPAVVMAERCCQYMFKDCSSLTATSELPAMTLAPYCYDTMFQNCSSLSTAPSLSSEILYDYCYANMFNGCSSLSVSENGTDGNVILELKMGTPQPEKWNDNMFLGTSGSFKGSPSIGKTYRCY